MAKKNRVQTAPEVSAGVVILRNDSKKGWCFLALKVYGRFDVCKGHVDMQDADDDNPTGSIGQIMNAAVREAREECGYTLTFDPNTQLSADDRIARLSWGNEYYVCRNLNKDGSPKKDVFLFAAETQCANFKIGVNDKGIREHDDGVWVPINDIDRVPLHNYLKPGVKWAVETMQIGIKSHELIERLQELSED
jgi:8-oxo-dGTP pyrophosphatase MutT (NUDIX family)